MEQKTTPQASASSPIWERLEEFVREHVKRFIQGLLENLAMGEQGRLRGVHTSLYSPIRISLLMIPFCLTTSCLPSRPIPANPSSFGNVMNFRVEGSQVTFEVETSSGNGVGSCCYGAEVRISSILPNVINVRLSSMDGSEEFETGAVLRHQFAPQRLEVTDSSPITIRAGNIVIRVDKEPFRLSFYRQDGTLLLAETSTGGMFWGGMWQVGVRFGLNPEDSFYGLGEPGGSEPESDLDLRGKRFYTINRQIPAPAHVIIPFLLSSSGYALFWDNSSAAEIDIGHSDANFLSYQAVAGQLNYYFFAAPSLYQILDDYTRLTGRPLMPPRWTLGFFQSRASYKSREEVEQLAAEFRHRGIPADAIVLDWLWFKEMGDLSFDPDRWPHPEEMIENLRKEGFKVMVIEEPYVNLESRNYEEGLRRGVYGRKPDGSVYQQFKHWGRVSLVDFTNPVAREWWGSLHRPLMEMGIQAWWLDLNEPEVHPYDMFHAAGPAGRVHNLISLNMAASIWEAAEKYKPGERLFIMSRSAYAGIQRYGAGVWSGDLASSFDALAAQPAIAQQVGLIGIPSWNSDIGGGPDPKRNFLLTPELYIRWIQFGTFNPVMRPHALDVPHEPWLQGEDAERISTEFIHLHYALIPYAYTFLREAYDRGAPLIRPLLLEFPTDPKTFHLADEFLYGRDLLVAPVLEQGARSRQVYLPAGEWYNYWTGEKVHGPITLEVETRLDSIPLFVRGGAILPLAPPMHYSDEKPLNPLTLKIYPDSQGAYFELYEDDGRTTRYQMGEFVRTAFSFRRNSEGAVVSLGGPEGDFEGQLPHRDFVLHLHDVAAPKEVLRASHKMESARSAGELAQMKEGWHFDVRTGVLLIKLVQVEGKTEVHIR